MGFPVLRPHKGGVIADLGGEGDTLCVTAHVDDIGLMVRRINSDGTLNVSYNCLDRHVEAGNGDRVALHWEGEPGDTRRITYAELTDEVKRAANVLEGLGVRVMVDVPESVATYLNESVTSWDKP